MRPVNTEAVLAELVQANSAVLVLFGGASCGVCQAVKPQLEQMARVEFPGLITAYVDCQGSASQLCASQAVFSLPVVQLWFDGQRFDEFVRVFSMGQVHSAIKRPYQLMGLPEP